MKTLYKVIVEANMDASHIIIVLVRASNKKNAAKIAEKKVRKNPHIFFTLVNSVTEETA